MGGFNRLEGTRGANSSDKRIEGVNNGGNVVDTSVNVEGVKELQEKIRVRWVDKGRICSLVNTREIFQG